MKNTKERLKDDWFSEGLPFKIWISDYKQPKQNIHWHEPTEIVYIIGGSCGYLINSKYYDVYEGDLIIVNGLDFHSLVTHKNTCVKSLRMLLPPSIISNNYQIKTRFKLVASSRILNLINSENNDLYNCVSSLISHLEKGIRLNEYHIISDVYRLMGLIFASNYDEHQNEDRFLQHMQLLERITPVLDYIENNYSERIALSDMAGMVNMGIHYFTRCFKKVTCYTLIDYLNLIRVSNAQNMLINSENNITEIAHSTGFSSLSYFDITFKKIVGVSPLEFRNSR